MKDEITGILLHLFVFFISFILFVSASILIGTLIEPSHALTMEAAKVGAPFTIGTLLLSFIIVRFLKTNK